MKQSAGADAGALTFSNSLSTVHGCLGAKSLPVSSSGEIDLVSFVRWCREKDTPSVYVLLSCKESGSHMTFLADFGQVVFF